jgi:cobalamin biosynthesis Mg chelatase CobN
LQASGFKVIETIKTTNYFRCIPDPRCFDSIRLAERFVPAGETNWYALRATSRLLAAGRRSHVTHTAQTTVTSDTGRRSAVVQHGVERCTDADRNRVAANWQEVGGFFLKR